MQTLQQVLSCYPISARTSTRLRDCIETCFECALACTACAAACTARKPIDDLLRCIRLDLDCADLCETVGRALSRQARPDWEVLRIEIEACSSICAACARECELHIEHPLDHFSACAKACRNCIERLRELCA